VVGNIWVTFTAVATAVPNRAAVIEPGRSTSFAALLDRASRLAGLFSAHGLGVRIDRGTLANHESGQSHVGLLLHNSAAYVESLLAAHAARAVPFNINYRYRPPELAALLEDAAAEALVYHARYAPLVHEALQSLPHRRMLLVQVADGDSTELLTGAVDLDSALDAYGDLDVRGHHGDDLYMLYTGGTTGRPKGVLWRQEDIWKAALGGAAPDAGSLEAVAAKAATSPPRTVLPVAPLMHAAGQWFAFRNLLAGATVVFGSVTDRLDARSVWSTVDEHRVGQLLIVGESFARPLIDELEQRTYDVRSLTSIVSAGAALTASTRTRIHLLVPGVQVIDTAGSSETGGALRSISTTEQPGQPGRFAPSATTCVLNEDRTGRADEDDDHPGWLATFGAVPLGYLGDPERTERTFPVIHGVRYSIPGDRARRLDDGSIELLGRDSSVINSGGEKIFAEEVESALLQHVRVTDAVVVGVPSERWGQEVVAVVSIAGGDAVADDEIIDTVRGAIAGYKAPKRIVRVDKVPRGPAGKADLAWAHAAARGAAAPTAPASQPGGTSERERASLEAFEAAARRWLSERMPPRPAPATLEWGVGSDDVSLFRDLPHDQEEALIEACRTWQRAKSDAGFGSIDWLPEHGGAGLDSEHARAFRRIEGEFETPPTHEAIGITLNLVAPTIRQLGTAYQREQYLRPMRRLDTVWCQMFSEPGAGSDVASASTLAVRDDDAWVLSGQKVWTSGAQFARYGLCIARTDRELPKHRGLTAFIVDMHDPAVDVRPLRQMTGGASFNEVFLNDVRIHDRERVGEVNGGWSVALTVLGFERAAVGGGGGGGGPTQAERLTRLAGFLACDHDPVMRQRLARIHTLEQIRRWTVVRSRAASRPSAVPGAEGSISKLLWTETLQHVSASAACLLGPRVIADTGEWGTYAYADFILGVPGYRLAGGTDEVMRNIIAERLLGLPKEPTTDRRS
jgi:3-oxocholest-4-en-26-oate---CoA ligase